MDELDGSKSCSATLMDYICSLDTEKLNKANWRRNREEPRYMNSAGTNVSTSSWSSANTPTWTPEHQAGSSNSVSFEMREDQRKRTMSNPRYMSFSERESDEM